MLISPILPIDIKGNIDIELLKLAEEVCIQSSSLLSGYNPQIILSIKKLLRITNSYYSNRIEAQSTHPIEIEKAMKKQFSQDTKEEQLQRLSLAHIKTQEYVEEYCSSKNLVISREFIKSIHREFYSADGMEKFLEIKSDAQTIIMQRGEFRETSVEVANHVAPSFDKIDSIFNYFEKEYQKIYVNNTKAMKLLGALSSHHRLVYIHPFLDGNGRVSRLHLDAMLFAMDLDGYGLWNISRGLARDVKGYQQYLSLADMIKQGATDGGGELSLRGLQYYLKYMLEVALDQITFMSKSLSLSTLNHRMNTFVELSQKGMYSIAPLPKYSEMLFSALLIKGEVQRGEVEKIISKSKKSAYTLVKTLLDMEYLESDSPRGALKLKLNTFFASKLILDLIP
ncbi:MAG: Fic family protein [Campylobacterales bacterium]|nr:Fic family protein [Campylobacterales bacterium]